MSVKKTKKL